MEAIDIKPDYPRHSGAAGEVAEVRRDCRNETLAVVAFAAKHHLEPTSVWLAGFALLLHRLSGQTAGSFTLCSGEALLSIDTSLDGPPLDFLAWLACVQDAVRQAASSRSGEKVHPVGFGSYGALSGEMECSVDISTNLLIARFRAGLFAHERVRELLDQLIVLVDQAVAESGRQVTSYSLVTKSARAILPDPTADLGFPECKPITETILAYAASTPDRPAVGQGGRSWSYRELSEASRAVARGLAAAGLEVGDCVAVTGPRSFGFVAAMLGVWRSGGVLVNIDPSLPEKRQALMLTEVKARFLVRVGSAASSLASRVEEMISISTQGELADYLLGTAPELLSPLSPEQAAYIFFTSGSTGTPKAVRGRHCGLSHFLRWQRQEFAIGPHDRASQLTALSFDVILRDSFLVLSSGGTLCIPGEWDALDPRRIIDWLHTERISVLHVVPSLARLWLNSVAVPTPLPQLKHVFFAGEPLTDVLVSGTGRAQSRRSVDWAPSPQHAGFDSKCEQSAVWPERARRDRHQNSVSDLGLLQQCRGQCQGVRTEPFS
jgi:non-ribosomal peptide synthetase component F